MLTLGKNLMCKCINDHSVHTHWHLYDLINSVCACVCVSETKTYLSFKVGFWVWGKAITVVPSPACVYTFFTGVSGLATFF